MFFILNSVEHEILNAPPPASPLSLEAVMNPKDADRMAISKDPGPEVIKRFSYSTQLSMKF